jgi:hypothetical protein
MAESMPRNGLPVAIDFLTYHLSKLKRMRSSRVVKASDSQCQSLGSIPASSDTVESEGRPTDEIVLTKVQISVN